MLDEERTGLIEEECGIFAAHRHDDASVLTYFGLHALQHRGQEACGIATMGREGRLKVELRRGLVSEQFDEKTLDALDGDRAIGHVRYSTSGSSSIRNAQPLKVHTKFGVIALAHNGNITNAMRLRQEFEALGATFSTESDTEVIAHLIARSEAEDMLGAVTDAARKIEGAFSLIGLTRAFTFALRDPHGVRPLWIGRLGEARLMASESSSFNLLGAAPERELEPGEMFVVAEDGSEQWLKPFEPRRPAPCIFELVYFARADSTVFGRHVYEARKEMGAVLAQEAPADGDVVVPVPDSGVPAALGYAQRSGIPFETGLVRSHYVGRTFIEPSSSIRHVGVKLKLSPVRSVIEGKRVVVVDDSIVRGTTARKIIELLREAGAAEVHVRVASPPTTGPCFYGIDTPLRRDLIAATHTLEEIREEITADSIAYLSIQGLRAAVGAAVEGERSDFCEACFTGRYPIPVEGARPNQGE